MGLFGKKYIYVDVCFLHGQHPYTYRTNDSTIANNTVVMVPAGDEIKPAIVTNHDPVWVYEIEAFDAMMND